MENKKNTPSNTHRSDPVDPKTESRSSEHRPTTCARRPTLEPLQKILNATDDSLWLDGQLLWWPEPLRQRISAEPVDMGVDPPLLAVQLETDLLCDVPDVEWTYEVVAATNSCASFSALVFDAATKTITHRALTYCHLEKGWPGTLVHVAATQIAEAQAIAEKIAEACCGKINVAATDSSAGGKLAFVSEALARLAKEFWCDRMPETLRRDLLAAYQDLEADAEVLVTRSESGLTCELPFAGGLPQTVLLVIEGEVQHPLLGGGVRLTMRVPRLPETIALTARSINELNRSASEFQYQFQDWGAWFADQTGMGFTCFVPWELCFAGRVSRLLLAMKARVKSLHEYLKLPNAHVNIATEKLRSLSELGLVDKRRAQ